METIFSLLDHQPKRILDLGYGDGQITNELHQRGYNVLGLDVSRKGCQNARERFPECDFRVYDGLNLPFEENSFDTIIMNDVLEHIPYSHMEQLIERVKEVLTPEGMIYISVTNRFELVEPHTSIPFLTWLPRVFWKPINKMFRGIENIKIQNIYPYTFRRLKSFCKTHDLEYINFTSVYTLHKFSDPAYIGNTFLRMMVKLLKKVKLLRLFYYLAYKFSVIIFICQVKKWKMTIQTLA